MQAVLAQDKALGSIRDRASESGPLADAAQAYVVAIDALDFSECPPEFVEAFRTHREAWQDAVPMLERFPQLRGEMHDLFDQLKQDPDTRSDMEALDKRIRDTWAEVEATTAVGQGEHFEAAAANSESEEDHSMANKHHSINYIELPAADLAAAKEFYAAVFGWTFTDWGPEYVSFDGAGIDGGFRGDGSVTSQPLGVLAVLYSDNLEATRDSIVAAGGKIVEPIFSFPGGRRFHFSDPSGNELAVWSE
jgi:predicted enzyme related to lactoylglutathione lyase